MSGWNFTDRTRWALRGAREAAAALRHEYIGTEHILLGVLRDRDSVAAAVLTNLGRDIDSLRAKIEAVVKTGNAVAPAEAERPYTSRAKKVLELAMMCARDDGGASVGTQHLLLGLLREKKGVAAQVLVHSGVTLSQVAAALGGVAKADERTAGDRPLSGRTYRLAAAGAIDVPATTTSARLLPALAVITAVVALAVAVLALVLAVR